MPRGDHTSAIRTKPNAYKYGEIGAQRRYGILENTKSPANPITTFLIWLNRYALPLLLTLALYTMIDPYATRKITIRSRLKSKYRFRFFALLPDAVFTDCSIDILLPPLSLLFLIIL
jgi:hypothetical protein